MPTGISSLLVWAFVASPLATPPASDRPKPPGTPDNLCGPVEDDRGARGDYSARARDWSAYEQVVSRPLAAALVATLAVVATRSGGRLSRRLGPRAR